MAAAAITQREVVVNGVRSLVRESGPTDAREAVVFVHGNPGSSEDWTDLMGRVGAFGRAVAPDMPAFGKADRPKAFEYTVPGYAAHLAGVLQQVGVDRAHLVLHDFGGPWGLAWASQHPKAVASITLVNIGIMVGYRWHKYARVWRTPILGELFQLTGTRGMLTKVLNAENPKPFPPAFVNRMLDDMDWGTKSAVLKLYRATGDIDGMSKGMAERLAPLKLPALVLWGTGDTYVPSRFAEQQREYFAEGTQVHLLDGCGHWPFIDEPERCAELIVPFLQKQVGSVKAMG